MNKSVAHRGGTAARGAKAMMVPRAAAIVAVAAWMGRSGRPSQALLLRFAAAFPFPAVSVIGHSLDRGLVRGLKNWLVAERAGPLSTGLIVHVQDLTGERRAHTPDSPESRRPEASTVREGCRHLRAYHEVRHGHLTERLRAERSGTPTVGSSPCVPEEPPGGAHQGLFSVTLCATTLPSRFV